MAHLDFISGIHNATKRNYVQRVVEYDKATCAQISKQFGKDYFDGDRQYGYGVGLILNFKHPKLEFERVVR